MKTNMKRLLALILALSMVMSLLSTSAWAADTSADGSGDPAVSSTEPQEAEPEEAAPEGNAEEAAPEGEPEEAAPEGEAAQPEEAETKPKEEQPKPKMKAKKQQAMSLTAQDYDPYASLKNTKTVITFDGKSWYLADYDADTVTLLAKECVGASKYNESGSFVEYSNDPPPTVKTAVDNWYNVNITADAQTAVSGNAMLLLTKSQADALSTEALKCSQASGADYNYWWLCSQVGDSDYAVVVNGESGAVNDLGYSVGGKRSTLGVRPALKLDLSKVTFDSTSNTFSVAHLDPVSYLAWDDTQKKLVEKKGDEACKAYTVVSNQNAWGTAGTETWYVVNTPSTENLTISGRITVSGTVNLILCDGATLTASKGITVTTGNTLNIYGQSAGTGALIANASSSYGAAGIGGSEDMNNLDGGTVTIHGGTVTATGSDYAAGIGGGNTNGGGSGCDVTIYGGKVTATGGNLAAGIGKGYGGSDDGTLTLGTGVSLQTSTDNSTWSAYDKDSNYRTRYMRTAPDPVTYMKATADETTHAVTFTEQSCADYTVVTASTTAFADGGWYVVDGTVSNSNRITVNDTANLILKDGAKLTASAGITTTGATLNIYEGWTGDRAETHTVGELVATGGGYGSAGIGGIGSSSGNGGAGGNVTINGGTVTAKGVRGGAGIGGGYGNSTGGSGGSVTINGGTVTATGGGTGSAGIGGGFAGSAGGSGGSVTINGGTVTANGGEYAAGIGGGYGSSDRNLGAPGDLILGAGVTLYGDSSELTDPPADDKMIASTPGVYNGDRYRYMKNTFTSHTHDFTYSASGATITATCTATATDCPLPPSSEGGTDHVANLTIAAPTAGGGAATLTGADDFGATETDIKYYTKTDGGWSNESSSAPTGNGFYKASITVTDGAATPTSYTASVTYGVNAISTDKTYTEASDHGTVAVPVVATANATVTINTTPATGYELNTLTVTKAGGGTIDVTKDGSKGSFTMPEENVTVSATFTGKTMTASLTVPSDSHGTANLLDDSYKAVDSVSKKAGEQFLLCVSPEDEYEYTVKFGSDNATKTEVGKTEYEAYLAYANSKNISVSPNTVLYWVTMPGAAEDTVTATVTFGTPHTYTILYQTDANTDAVFCKIAVDQGGTEVVKYAMMSRGATLGNTKVWSLTITSSFDPTKIAFVGSNAVSTDEDKTALKNQLQSATPSDATVSQTTDSWNNATGGGQYLIIGDNAKVVTAIFVSDANAAATDEEYSLDNAEVTGVEAYQFAVCPTDTSGNATSFGTVQAPAAPTPAPEGKEFVGWRGFKFDSINATATDETYNASDTINVRENTTFTAVWKPSTPTITLNLNGGTMSGETPASVTYNTTLSLGTPTRSGYAFDRWTVSEAVTESGTYFAKGSTFDVTKNITANLKLTAQWKHVHSYKCYQISSFGDKLAKYMDYNPYIHVAACGCGDVQLVAHEFDANGKCKCGYQKPGAATTVTLTTSYVKMSGGNVTATINGGDEDAKKNEEVEICAPGYWGGSEFSKWEYKIGNGEWTFLTADAYASFLIPATMSVRAVYTNPVAYPTVTLSSRHYDDHAENNGQTWTMANILYQMDYKLPDGCTFVDGGIKLGDNSGISYYFIQQVRMSYDNESKGIIAGLGAGLAAATVFTDGIFAAAQTFNDVASHMNDTGIKYNYLETEKCVVPEKLTAATLAQYMYEGKPVNVEKYPPIYWEARVPTKGMSGSIATVPPLRFAQKNNQEHYIYGIAWMRYKDQSGNIQTIYTNAINPTAKDHTKTVTNPVQ